MRGIDKIGYTRWFLNIIGYPFFLQRGRVDVRLRNASKSRSEACAHCAQSVRDTPHRFCGLPRLKTARKRRPKKCPYTDYPIMCGILRGIPRSLLRFYKPPDFVHIYVHPILHTGKTGVPVFVHVEKDLLPCSRMEDPTCNRQVAHNDATASVLAVAYAPATSALSRRIFAVGRL